MCLLERDSRVEVKASKLGRAEQGRLAKPLVTACSDMVSRFKVIWIRRHGHLSLEALRHLKGV